MIKLLFTICFLLAVNFSSQQTEAKSAPPGNGNSVPANVLIMLDTSGSMGWITGSSSVSYPMDVTFDSDGNLYVGVWYDTVYKYDSTGNFITSWGGYNGTSADGKFDYISALDVDSNNNVYVADYGFSRIQKFSSDGTFITKMSLASYPARGLEIDSNDNVYALNGSGTIEKFDSNGTKLATWSNTGGYHVAIDSSDNIYVSKYYSQQVEVYNSNGVYQYSISPGFYPYGLHVDDNDKLIITDLSSSAYRYELNGTFIESWTGVFYAPRGVATDASNKIYVADFYNHRITATDGSTFMPSPQTGLEQATNVIQLLVSNSSLTDGANFGLMEWNSTASMVVDISDSGASEIYSSIESLTAGGGTYLDNAMTLAQSYFLGSSSPRDSSLSCQKNILIVISDGYWYDSTASSTAESLYNDSGIETFVVGFQTSGNSNYITLSQKGGTYPDSPLYADDWQELYNVLSSYISKLISSSLTFAAPTVIPGVQGEDSILQSTFTYKTRTQWKGRLTKYALTETGGIGDEQWDAGEELNEKAADDRNLWTVGAGLTDSYNNFTTSERDRLRPGLEENLSTSMTDDEIDNLIEYIRGKDSYEEFTTGYDDEGTELIDGERWKLADIYHSEATIVGPPSAYTSNESHENSEAYYRFVNGYNSFKSSEDCGSICSSRNKVVFVGSNAGILHAFDFDTGEELWGFIPPSMLPKFEDIISENDAESNAIFGIDGTPTIKDIYYGGQWRTILMAGLRQGGNSYFALDVTDVANPEHLFTIDHNTFTNTVSYWDSAGNQTSYNLSTTTPPAEYDFSTLGESWSQPIILKAPIGGVDKWVAVVNGGFNNNVTNYANDVFILDLENGGQIVNTINLPDNNGSNGIIASLPPIMTAITADSDSSFTHSGALLYVTDTEGKLWKINLTDDSSQTLYDTTIVFNAESTDDNDRYAFHDLSATLTDDGRLLHFFGTGNIQRLDSSSSTTANRIYGVYDENYPSYADTTTFTIGSMQDGSVSCPSELQKGWYLNLGTDEKVTSQIAISGSSIFTPIFTPNATDLCESGTSVLVESDMLCGTVIQTNVLGTGVASGATVYNGNIYIGISTDDSDSDIADGYEKGGNLVVGTPTNTSDPEAIVESWREDF